MYVRKGRYIHILIPNKVKQMHYFCLVLEIIVTFYTEKNCLLDAKRYTVCNCCCYANNVSLRIQRANLFYIKCNNYY